MQEPGVDLFSFINEALEYFVEEEGWSPIYAFQVIMKQGSEVGLAELKKQSLKTIMDTPTPEVMMQNIEFHKKSYSHDDVENLVDRIKNMINLFLNGGLSLQDIINRGFIVHLNRYFSVTEINNFQMLPDV